MDISELGSNIKKIRELKNWTLNRLKQESGVGYATLHDIENGKSLNLNSSNLEKVARALNVSTNELLGIDVIEYVVTDLEKTIEMVFESDELELDGKLLNNVEKDELKDLFSLAINSIRIRRKNLK